MQVCFIFVYVVLYLCVYEMVGFYGTLNIVSYLMSNPFLYLKTVLF